MPSNNAKVKCQCGKSWGRYVGDVDAEIGGAAIPIGFANRSLVSAVHGRPASGPGERFDAFVIAKDCPTIRSVNGKRSSERNGRRRNREVDGHGGEVVS